MEHINSPPTQGRFIAFDGPDGVWKSTIVKLLAEENEGVYYKTPGTTTTEERNKYDWPEISVQERFNFYVQLLVRDTDKIQSILNKGKTVFCDRFIASTIVHHKAMDDTIDISQSNNVLSKIKVDCSIVLYGDIDMLIKRISLRAVQTRFEQDKELMIRTQNLFKAYPQACLFDNTRNSIVETIDNINHRLRKLNIL